ncbi:hypothetical protein GA0115246_109733 [Streptomyces sp. SolWspMP-sol7th]|nr:hypothetical protein GA0115246_109733 [Streptomyces sp. SolWspMP-sol7th]
MTVSPSISMRTPVRTGSVSSRPAAMATCCAAEAKTSPGTVPVAEGICGSAGYSSTGSVCSVKRDDPQVTVARTPSVEISTGRLGRARQMSARSRPETRTVPSSSVSASTETRAETS